MDATVSGFRGALCRTRSGTTTHLDDQVLASFAETLQHAHEEMSRLHQVSEVRMRLSGFIVLPQQGQKYLPVFHQVEYVT